MFFFNNQYKELLKDIEINILNNNCNCIEYDEKILNKTYYHCESQLLKELLIYYVKRKSNKIIEIKNYIIDKLLYYKRKNNIIISIISIISIIILIFITYIIIKKYCLNKSFNNLLSNF